ncbi:unknown [Salmonella phage FelixO1]|uniref:Uncharacterized protein n=1 Tax=Salmonella phage Felix O1 (isolate Felix O1-VT1) TaxID=1283336 RepID=Q6KGP2_BPFO1|nr:unknown [Salmonella phage FelixO1]
MNFFNKANTDIVNVHSQLANFYRRIDVWLKKCNTPFNISKVLYKCYLWNDILLLFGHYSFLIKYFLSCVLGFSKTSIEDILTDSPRIPVCLNM